MSIYHERQKYGLRSGESADANGRTVQKATFKNEGEQQVQEGQEVQEAQEAQEGEVQQHITEANAAEGDQSQRPTGDD